MYSYIRWAVTLIEKSNEYSQEKRGLSMHSSDILHRPRGIILIESTKIIWFSRRSGGGGWSLLSEAKSLKTTQVRRSGSSTLRFDGSCDGQAWGWTGYPEAAQGLYSLKLKQRVTNRLKSTQIRWFSWLSDGRLDQLPGGQRHSNESWKTTLESQGT
jgi:hypothetical protein